MFPDTSQHRVFWVSYKPAIGEGVQELAGSIGRLTTHETAFFGRDEEVDGVVRYEFVLCLSKPMQTKSCGSLAKWRRAGAKGFILDVQYPRAGQGVKDFILERVAVVRQCGVDRQFGSDSDVFLLRERIAALLKQQQRQSRARRKRRRVASMRTSTWTVSPCSCSGSSYSSVSLTDVAVEVAVERLEHGNVDTFEAQDLEVQLALTPHAGIVMHFCVELLLC